MAQPIPKPGAWIRDWTLSCWRVERLAARSSAAQGRLLASRDISVRFGSLAQATYVADKISDLQSPTMARESTVPYSYDYFPSDGRTYNLGDKLAWYDFEHPNYHRLAGS